MEIFDFKSRFSQRARQHLEKYWRLSRQFYEQGDHSLAAFFGITLMEEVGKVVILGNYQLGSDLDQKSFYNHRKKYMYAVYSTILVNSRVTRIYGDQEKKFARWFRRGKLFSIRNNSLYLDFKHDNLRVPEDTVSKEDAFLLVCVAGEVYGEIQGLLTGAGLDEWKRIINEIDAFRQRNGELPCG
jgi:AbiV family abortive infection protein